MWIYLISVLEKGKSASRPKRLAAQVFIPVLPHWAPFHSFPGKPQQGINFLIIMYSGFRFSRYNTSQHHWTKMCLIPGHIMSQAWLTWVKRSVTLVWTFLMFLRSWSKMIYSFFGDKDSYHLHTQSQRMPHLLDECVNVMLSGLLCSRTVATRVLFTKNWACSVWQ